MDEQIDRYTDTERERQTEFQIESQQDRFTDRQGDRWIKTERAGEKEGKNERERESERAREPEPEPEPQPPFGSSPFIHRNSSPPVSILETSGTNCGRYYCVQGYNLLSKWDEMG